MATKYQELDGRHVYKTQEVYKDAVWGCKGSSYVSMDLAKAAWKKNKEKKIAKIDGAVDRKEGRIRLDKALPEWYDMYKRHEVKGGRPRSKRVLWLTDMPTWKCLISPSANSEFISFICSCLFSSSS